MVRQLSDHRLILEKPPGLVQPPEVGKVGRTHRIQIRYDFDISPRYRESIRNLYVLETGSALALQLWEERGRWADSVSGERCEARARKEAESRRRIAWAARMPEREAGRVPKRGNARTLADPCFRPTRPDAVSAPHTAAHGLSGLLRAALPCAFAWLFAARQ